MPYIGKSTDGFGIRERYRYSASGSQTAFTGSDLDSKTLNFDSGSLLDVYLNGVLLDTLPMYGIMLPPISLLLQVYHLLELNLHLVPIHHI